MDKEKILNGLNNQAETIKTHVIRLKTSKLSISLLDVDLLKKKTVEFYDMISELEQLIKNNYGIDKKITPDIVAPNEENSPVENPVVEKLTVEVEIIKDKIIEEINIDNSSKIIKDEIVENTVTIKETIIDKPVVTTPSEEEKVQEPTTEEVIEEDKDEEPTIFEQSQPQQTTYDLFSGNTENVIAEKFHFTEDQSIADKMQKSHISNIREAIGINEKFLFINELFNGDLGRYNKILDDINELPTKQGVDTYLFELKIQFQWADDSLAYAKLKKLLERKFA